MNFDEIVFSAIVVFVGPRPHHGVNNTGRDHKPKIPATGVNINYIVILIIYNMHYVLTE